MSQLTVANYPNQIPLAADSMPFVRLSDNVLKTVTVTQLAALIQSLASLVNTVSVYSADHTLTDDQFVEVNSGAAVAITLPASSLNAGRAYRIFNKGAGAVTITPNGSDTIKGAATMVLAQYDDVLLQSDGLGMWAAIKSA